MAQITLKGNPVSTVGELPAVGGPAPDFKLVRTDLSEVTLSEFSGKHVVLNIFPSIDTPTCANSVRTFNARASEKDDTVVLCISADLPFAHQRFCGSEGLDSVMSASSFRSPEFGRDYGVAFADGPLVGLLSRAVVVVGPDGKVLHAQQVPEIADEPDYDAALKAL